jgi:hypothetical protein
LKIIDETVKVAKEFLENNADELQKLSANRRLNTVGADMICKFLNWNETRIRYALERLRLIYLVIRAIQQIFRQLTFFRFLSIFCLFFQDN